MSSVSGYSPGGYIAKLAYAAAEEAAKRKQQQQALSDAEAAVAEEEKAATDAADTVDETEQAVDENGDTVVAESDETSQTDEEKAAAQLDEFRKGFQKEVRALTLNTHFILTKISLDIDDAGYEKMMNDPAYEKKIMGMIKDALGSPLNTAPTSVKVTVNAKGENAEATGGGTSSGLTSGLSLGAGSSASAIRRSSGLDNLSNQISAVLYYRLGSDPVSAANALLNKQA